MARKKEGEPNAILELFRNYYRAIRVLFSIARVAATGYLVMTVLGAMFPVLSSYMQGLVINAMQHLAGAGLSAITQRDWLLFLGFLATAVLPQLLSILENYYFWIVWFAVGEWSELIIIQKKGVLDVAMHEDKKVSDLHNRVTENFGRLTTFADRMYDLIRQVATIVLAVGVLIFAQWQLFLIVLLATIPELIVEVRFGKRIYSIHGSGGELRRKYWDNRGLFLRLSSLIEMKLFQNIPHFLGMIKDLFLDFRNQQKREQRLKIFNQFFTQVFSQAAIVFAIIVFTRQVIEGTLLVGTFVFYLGTIRQFRSSLSAAFRIIGQQYGDSLFISDLFAYLDLKPKVVSPKDGHIVASGTPDIRFENVTFAYPGVKKPVLKNFTLHIPPGERIALVGVNGAGKTTFVKLLCRFYDPDEGRILVNGFDLRHIDLESWYQVLGALFQDYTNYHLLVKDAIAVGRTGNAPDIKKVMEAAKAAEADLFIQEWEKSYKQMLGKDYTGGVQPSVGQWQKLGLARTFYRDPRVLILDEPTSSIDAEAEAKIFEKIEAIHGERTVILISHRFSTVRTADRICVIKDGRISEYGTHEELMEANKIYAKLFRLQAKGYK